MTTYTNQILEMTQFEGYKLYNEPIVISKGEIKNVMVFFIDQMQESDRDSKPLATGHLVNLETGDTEIHTVLNCTAHAITQCMMAPDKVDAVIILEEVEEEKAHQEAETEFFELVEYINDKMDGKGVDGYTDHAEGFTGYVTLKDSNFDGINSEVDVHNIELILQRDLESTHTTISATITYFHFEDKRDYTKEWEISTVKNSNTKPHQTIKKITREIEKEISYLD